MPHHPTRISRLALVVTVLVGSLAAIPARADTPPSSPAAPPPHAPPPKRLYVGGGVGMAFGEVDYIEISPLLGYRVAPRVLLGGSLLYRYRNDDRYAESLSLNDYGASGFVRFDVYQGFFGQAEYEYLDYEYPLALGGTDRTDYSSVLIGPGYTSPLGRNGGLYFAALYNLSYDSDDVNSPYDDPWVIRAGVGFTF